MQIIIHYAGHYVCHYACLYAVHNASDFAYQYESHYMQVIVKFIDMLIMQS